VTGAWPKLFALCIRGPDLMCHMLHARYSRILFLPACLLAHVRGSTSEGSTTVIVRIDTVVVSQLRLYAVSLTWWACCALYCHRVRAYVYQRAASGAQNSIEMYRATTKLRELRFSLRATAINFSQPGIVSVTPAPFPASSSPSLSQRQDLPLKPSYSSTRKKPPKGTGV